MLVRTICTIALSVLALLAFSTEARADYLVLCPTGGVLAEWDHTSGHDETGPHPFDASKELLVTPSRVLRCTLNMDFIPSFSYPSSGACGGTVELWAQSAVFGRTEFFSSGRLPVEADFGGGVCIMNAPDFVVISMTMSEACSSLRTGNGWDCPDSAEMVSAP
jgi:hypothetical protein